MGILKICILSFFLSALSNDQQAEKEFLLFSAEVDQYISLATQLKDAEKNLNSNEKKELSDQIKQSATRIAESYLNKMSEPSEQSEPESNFHLYLQQTIEHNKDLSDEFVFLGNSFVEYANTVLQEHYKKQKRSKIMDFGRGIILNFALTNGYILIKLKSATKNIKIANDILTKSLNGLNRTIVFAMGNSKPINLPINPKVKTAEDFYTRYPRGEDFIQSLKSGGHP